MSTALLPDMPQASKFCRICQLVSASEDWARLLYTYRFDRKMKIRDLIVAMEPHITEWNKTHPKNQLQTFSTKAVTKHFSKHVPAPIQMQYALQNKMGAVKKVVTEKAVVDKAGVSTAVVAHVESQVAKSVAVFTELQDLFTRLKALFEDYLTRKPQIDGLSIHLDIIREMRKTLGEIGKMRQSKELVKIAVRSVIDTFMTKMIDDLGRSIDDMRSKVAKRTDQEFANQVTEDFRKQVVDSVIESARTAIERVKVEFALEDQEN